MGGMLAVHLARLAPERVTRLVLDDREVVATSIVTRVLP
jgi:pimeloyl-ACP methyl ester carboxylesterase